MAALYNILGILFILGILVALSKNRKGINIKLILKAILAQFVLCVFLVKFEIGRIVIQTISSGLEHLISYSKNGIEFVFGPLASPANLGFIFIIHVLCILIFIGSVVNLLSYLGLLGFIVSVIGKGLGYLLKTSKIENFVSVSNMFIGQTDAILLFSKYIPKMSQSAIFVTLVAGMSSMSVSILGGYAAMGIKLDFLILAAGMVPFGCIYVSKILLPDEQGSVLDEDVKIDRNSCGSNFIDALSIGALDGLKMALAIGASLIAVISFIALINGCLSPLNITLEQIVGWIFYPFAFLFSIDGDFTQIAGQIIGTKFILNEFIAFSSLTEYLSALDYRSQAIMTVALAGFANISSMAICLSAIASVCPEKRTSTAKLLVKGLAGAFSLNLLNAYFVGLVLAF